MKTTTQRQTKMFSIVQTKKHSKAQPKMTVVPSKWLKNGKVYWPKSNLLLTLLRQSESTPDITWKSQPCKIIATANTYAKAEKWLRNIQIEGVAATNTNAGENICNESEILERLSSIEQHLEYIEQKFDAQNNKLSKIINFMQIIEKRMQQTTTTTSSSKKPKPSPKNEVSPPAASIDDEDLIEFQTMKPAVTSAQLYMMENSLENPEYAAKFKRYMKTIKKLDGKAQGKVVFKEVMRRLVEPNALLQYSWRGQKRTDKRDRLLSFEAEFPNFISFINTIVCLADSNFVEDDTKRAFCDFLRHKNTELKRNQMRLGCRRSASIRRRKPNLDDETLVFEIAEMPSGNHHHHVERENDEIKQEIEHDEQCNNIQQAYENNDDDEEMMIMLKNDDNYMY